jgi:hypothetical protein
MPSQGISLFKRVAPCDPDVIDGANMLIYGAADCLSVTESATGTVLVADIGEHDPSLRGA